MKFSNILVLVLLVTIVAVNGFWPEFNPVTEPTPALAPGNIPDVVVPAPAPPSKVEPGNIRLCINIVLGICLIWALAQAFDKKDMKDATKMKNLALFFLLVLSVYCSGCAKQQDPQTQNNTSNEPTVVQRE